MLVKNLNKKPMRLLATKIFHLFYKGNMSAIYNSKVELVRVKRREIKGRRCCLEDGRQLAARMF